MLRLVIILSILVWLVAAPAQAQLGTADIRGLVADQQGAVLPGVAIVVRNHETGMFRETTSSSDGTYFMNAMLPGTYEIDAELQGFKKYHRGDVRLEVGKTISIDVQLEIGSVQEVVVVGAATPLLDTTSNDIGGSVESQEMADVPSFNRSFSGYLSLLPGVAARIAIDSFGAGSITVSGQAFRNVSYLFDGGNNNDDFDLGTGGSQVRVPLEAVQEFRLLTAQFDAEFGTTAGGVVSAVSKQGTNLFHGSAFGFLQDSALTARDYFARTQNLAKPPTRQQQWGGTIGGPIVLNKAHFFVSLERVLQDRGITINIPARPELSTTQFTQDRVWNVLARFDHQVTANHTWAVRWLREWSPQYNQFPNTATAVAAHEQERDTDWTVVGTLSSVIGQTRVNTVRTSITSEDLNNGNPNFFESDRQQDELLPTLAYLSFTDQQSARANRRFDRGYAFEDTFAWFVPSKAGTHDVKFGVQYLYTRLRTQNWGNQNGTFTFSHDLPFEATNPRSYPERFSVRVPGPLDFLTKGHFISGFVQDKWQTRSRLTLSLGARYDLEIMPIREQDNPKFRSPTDYPIDKNNISPRLGATYALDRIGRSIVRGGFGIFYQRTPWTIFTNMISQGVFADSFTVTFPANSADPGPSGGQFPTDPMLMGGIVVDRNRINTLFPAGTRQRNSGEVFLDNPDRHLPWSRHITAGYERQIGTDLVAGVDYIHSGQRELYMRKNLNPGLRTSTSRTSQIVRVDQNFVTNVWEIGNYGWIDYHALQVHVDKRLSRGYSVRGSYTLSRSYGDIDMGVNEAIDSQLGDDLRLNLNEGPTILDVRNILSVSGTLDVPGGHGLKISGVLQARGGSPFTLTDSRTDPDRNGFFQEPLPPGEYRGVGPDAITVENDGGRRGARGPGYARLDLRGGYRFRLPRQRTLDAFVDVFNTTNRASFNNPTGDRRLADFLIVRSIVDGGPTRLVQLTLRYAF